MWYAAEKKLMFCNCNYKPTTIHYSNTTLCTTCCIRKNIGEELNLANWRIKIKSPIFYLANLFCTRLTQNLARDPSVVAVI